MAAMRTSRRSLFILQEIRKDGQKLGLPNEKPDSEELSLPMDAEDGKWWYCDIEFPLTKDLVDAKGDEGYADVSRFKLIHVHAHVIRGPYAGGTFVLQVDLRATPDYPNESPKCSYLTKIWHPNVNETSGKICHSHLRGPSDPTPGTWNPMLRLQHLIQGILGHFNPEDSAFAPMDPLNPVAAAQYLEEEHAFLAQAADWTTRYATPRLIDPVNLAS